MTAWPDTARLVMLPAAHPSPLPRRTTRPPAAEPASLALPRDLSGDRYDNIVRIAQHVFDVSMAAVNLVDETTQTSLAVVGTQAADRSRNGTLCDVTVRTNAAFVVPDARLDPRFALQPFVTGPPFLRFYAGEPVAGPNGQPVARVVVLEVAGGRFQPGREHRHERPGVVEVLVHVCRDARDPLGEAGEPGGAAHQRAGPRRDHGRGHALAHHVGHDHLHPPVVEQLPVVEVTTDVASRDAPTGHVVAADDDRAPRQQTTLHLARLRGV
jgi:hypothetical protein